MNEPFGGLVYTISEESESPLGDFMKKDSNFIKFQKSVKEHNLEYSGTTPYVSYDELTTIVWEDLGWDLRHLVTWAGKPRFWEERTRGDLFEDQLY